VSEAPLVVSYGMGVDSTAMLVGLYARGFRPTAILFADTGSEHPETYAYLPTMQGWLESVGFPSVEVVCYRPARTKSGVIYTSLEENCLVNHTLPSLAFGRKSCSLKWKRSPMDRWVQRNEWARKCWMDGGLVHRAIGYDAGPTDSKRAWKLTADERYAYVYPLREWGWDRAECKRQIARAGLPVPRKSSCYFCPAMKPWEVDELVDHWPELADRICAIEDGARPNLRTVEGLWRRATKTRPGSMADYIHGRRAGVIGRAEVRPDCSGCAAS
jgi:hypothetical protein